MRVFASSFLGPVVGKKVVSYYNSLMLGADPIAKAALYDDDFKKNVKPRFVEKYGSGGTNVLPHPYHDHRDESLY